MLVEGVEGLPQRPSQLARGREGQARQVFPARSGVVLQRGPGGLGGRQAARKVVPHPADAPLIGFGV
jgi:hypothetical protein